MPTRRIQPTKLDIIDGFILSSVTTIVVIRAFLIVTGFPSISGDVFHIAHMLWGGLALMIALLISLLAPKSNRLVLALVGGVGFGFFIDEVGKFVSTLATFAVMVGLSEVSMEEILKKLLARH